MAVEGMNGITRVGGRLLEKEGAAVWEAGKDGLVQGTRRAGGRRPIPRPETQEEEHAVKVT